ncbi:hypothetical protein [Aurantiacibacter aquimixticola]|uniref:Uncharacterized protein n=1 Tax=Aurantiacibacter aquimixticola TaxID=1958945 RepID=A0A419RVF5_9SPHN|nr:hypothetical protein [Aurantiacibacter aquimixticola]RJY09765.1 hypothetical protein D6201_10740 [Aurantiacibacter aquimixticola]
MQPDRRTPPTTKASRNHAATLIRDLNRVPELPYRSQRAMQTVLGIRWLALCSRRRHDPIVELTRRLGSITAAKAFIDFADLAGRCWPENITVLRPCCSVLSPDETVFVDMIEAARMGDRAAFSSALDGFIRADRHDRLYAAAVAAIALMD